ncbi:MAG: hypothetical protein MJ183_07305 [Treponemataceae bacterium]|nr:hypothetical protein [Treponemataceae bacterium]
MTVFSFFTVFSACLTAILSGCSDFADRLPSAKTKFTLSPETAKESGTLIWIDSENRLQEHFISRDEADSFLLDTPADSPVPVLFYGLRSEHPAGCIFPYQTELTETGGFCARILYLILTGGKGDIRLANCFNWQKFHDTAKKLANLNRLDTGSIAEAIAQGSFSAELFKEN